MKDTNRQFVRQIHMFGEGTVTLCGCWFAHWQFIVYPHTQTKLALILKNFLIRFRILERTMTTPKLWIFWIRISWLKNLDFEIFTFRQATQLPEESIAQFCTGLRKLASICEFHDINREIKAALIQNCLSTRLRRLALREDTLTLNDLLSKARALEVSDIQASDMEHHIPLAQSSHNLNRIQ